VLSKIESSPTLRTALNDPAFAKAAEEMGRDPSSIPRYAKSHPQWINALREFCGVIGQEFDQQAAPKLDKTEQAFVDGVLGNEAVKVCKLTIERID
jgi:hypothetical protein